MKSVRVAVVAIVISAVLSFFLAGGYLYQAFIGLDPAAFPFGEVSQSIGRFLFPNLNIAVGGVVVALDIILLLALASFWIVKRTRAAQIVQTDPSRRGFLAGAGAGVVAGVGAFVAGLGASWARAGMGVGNEGRGWARIGGEIFGGDVVKIDPSPQAEWAGARIQAYGRLGRTEWPVSDIVMGTGPLQAKSADLVRLALDRGINYIDTAPDYSASGSENAVGEGIQGFPRDKFFLATKFCSLTGHLPPNAPVDRYVRVIDESLSRLGTDYVDLIHVHSCDEVDRLLSDNMFEAFDRLKQAGKARFLGFSTHTPNLVQVVNAAIDSGRFDVMMVAYHHGIWSALDDLIAKARREQDMGVVAMKTLKGARHENLAGFERERGSYAQAALRWVHSNPNVSCAVISMFDRRQIDEYLVASGQKATKEDVAILEKYDRQIVGTYCAPHCGACLSSCPEEVPIHDVLRHRMYFEDYRAEKVGMEAYAKLEKNASACLGCSAPCAGSCPVGIPIQERMIGAHDLLSLS